MRLKKRKYPSKLLLFGEYGVLLGLDALAVAFPVYYGRLELTDDEPDKHLLSFFRYLKKVSYHFPYKIQLEKLENDIENGLKFNSNIPFSYGLGSSGALVAAIFENYIDKKSIESISDPRALKTSLALLEAHFHGVSSGIDPLVSITGKPVLVRRSGKVYLLDKPVLKGKNKLHFFLIDSKKKGKTDALVSGFMSKMDNQDFSETFRTAYKNFSNGAIRHLVNKKYDDFYDKFKKLSDFQLKHMNELIPDNIKDYFNQSEFALKICGSGGGGYFLGATRIKDSLKYLKKEELIIL